MSKVPKHSGITRKALSSALKCCAEELQGHEHLLSEKGSIYELMKQTRGLRDEHDEATASLLHYHDLKTRVLKTKVLGPDTHLNDEQKKVISKLAENKELTMKMLENLEVNPRTTARVLVKLHKEGLLESDLCARVLECEDPDSAAEAAVSQKESDRYSSSKEPLLSCVSVTPGSPANIPESIALNIENAMEKAGYRIKRNICYGVAWTGLLACVRSGGQAYMERMQYLKQMDIPPLAHDHKHQLHAFFDAVALSAVNYTHMTGYQEGIGSPGREQEITFPGSIIVGENLHGAVPVVRHAFITECNPETFINFLRQTRKNNKGLPFGVMINCPYHAASIGFDGNKWLAADGHLYHYTYDMDVMYDYLRRHSFYHKENDKIIATMEVVTVNGTVANRKNMT